MNEQWLRVGPSGTTPLPSYTDMNDPRGWRSRHRHIQSRGSFLILILSLTAILAQPSIPDHLILRFHCHNIETLESFLYTRKPAVFYVLPPQYIEKSF